MIVSQLSIGQQVHWHRTISNYGHICVIQVTVRKIGKRVRIEVPLRNGRTRKVSVRPENLHPQSEMAATV